MIVFYIHVRELVLLSTDKCERFLQVAVGPDAAFVRVLPRVPSRAGVKREKAVWGSGPVWICMDGRRTWFHHLVINDRIVLLLTGERHCPFRSSISSRNHSATKKV